MQCSLSPCRVHAPRHASRLAPSGLVAGRDARDGPARRDDKVKNAADLGGLDVNEAVARIAAPMRSMKHLAVATLTEWALLTLMTLPEAVLSKGHLFANGL